MFTWLASNWGTILISAALIAVVSLIVIKMKKDRKRGKLSCGGNCAHCAMRGCRSQK